MKGTLSRIRKRLDAWPVWGVVLLNAGVLALWTVDLRAIDPLPFLDEIFVGGVMAGSAYYLWNRLFGPPTALAAESRRRLAEVETLFGECEAAARGSEIAGAEVARMSGLLDRVRAIEQRIEQAELVLGTPQYSVGAAEAEVARLERAHAEASDAARPHLAGALEEARRHRENIGRIRATRDELGAAFERIFQLVRRIHSQILGLGLTDGASAELASSVSELGATLDAYERDRKAAEEAAALVDRELEQARARSTERRDAERARTS